MKGTNTMATTTNTKPGKNNTAARARGFAAGTSKYYTDPNEVLELGGASYTVAEIQAKLARIGELRDAVLAAQVAARTRVAAERAELPALTAFLADYAAFVKARFGTAHGKLADFTLVPPKARRALTPEEKAAAKAKREATRKARHTMGPLQKKGIVGNVTGVVVTPIVAPTHGDD